MKRKTIQGLVLSANVTGLLPTKMQATVTIVNGVAPMQKSVVTGISSGIFLNPSDLAIFGEGQLEKANSNCYSVGNIREIFAEKGNLRIRLSRFISGCGHPPSEWETEANVELVIDLGEYDFAYIGSGDNGGGSRLFLRSKHFLRGGEQTIRIFPANGKLLDPLTVDALIAMRSHGGWGSVTVPPPKASVESSLFWRRPKPWLREYVEAFGD